MKYLGIVLALVAAPAHAFLSDGLVVRGGADAISVTYRPSTAQSEYWCAVGNYVIGPLGLPVTTRIARLEPPRRGVDPVFSTRADAVRSSGRDGLFRSDTGLVHLPGGNSMTAAHASSLCGFHEFESLDKD